MAPGQSFHSDRIDAPTPKLEIAWLLVDAVSIASPVVVSDNGVKVIRVVSGMLRRSTFTRAPTSSAPPHSRYNPNDITSIGSEDYHDYFCLRVAPQHPPCQKRCTFVRRPASNSFDADLTEVGTVLPPLGRLLSLF